MPLLSFYLLMGLNLGGINLGGYLDYIPIQEHIILFRSCFKSFDEVSFLYSYIYKGITEYIIVYPNKRMSYDKKK